MIASGNSDVRWPRVALGKLCDIQLGKMLQPSPSNAADELTPYLRAGSLSALDDLGALPQMYASRIDRATYGIEAGDLLVAEGGDPGRSAFAPSVPSGTIIQNSLHRLRPDRLDRRFLGYFLEAVYCSGWLDVLCNKSTFGHLTREKLANLNVPLAPDAVQRAVADFLDGETGRIDALITAKRCLIDALGERLISTMAEAMDACLSPRLIKLGQVLDRIIDYRGATPPKTDHGVPLLTASNIVGGRVDLDASRQFVSAETYEEWMVRGFPQRGDVLLTTEAPLGEVAMIQSLDVALAQRLMLLRPRQDLVLPEYLYLFLRSARGRSELLARASGSTVMGVRTDRLRDLPVVVPTMEQQDEVVRRVATVTFEATRIVERTARQIELLVERRQALITAAVTGELDIPGVAA